MTIADKIGWNISMAPENLMAHPKKRTAPGSSYIIGKPTKTELSPMAVWVVEDLLASYWRPLNNRRIDSRSTTDQQPINSQSTACRQSTTIILHLLGSAPKFNAVSPQNLKQVSPPLKPALTEPTQPISTRS